MRMVRYGLCRVIAVGLTLSSSGFLAGCSPQGTATAPPAAAADLSSTEGTISFTGGAIALGIGYQWGSGTLTYRGNQYPFRVTGLSVLDVGASRVTGTGLVHNLRNLADFNGNYVSATAGATVAGGASATTLRNQNGVTIDGISTGQGLRLTLAPGGANITLSQ